MKSNMSHSTTFRDYLKIIFRHKIIFFILPPAILIPLYFMLELQTPTYQSSVTMYVKAAKQTEADYYSGVGSRSLVEEHSQLVKTNIVLERVVKALKLYEIPIDYEIKFYSRFKSALRKKGVEQSKQRFANLSAQQKEKDAFQRAMRRLRANVGAEPIPISNFFIINVKDFDPSLAPVIANSVSRSYIIFDLEQQIEELKLKYGEKHSTFIQLNNYIAELQTKLDGKSIPDLEALGPATIKIIAQAGKSGLIGGVNKNTLFPLSLFASIFLGVLFCFAFDILDQSIRSPKDIESFLGIPFLGSIYKKKTTEKRLISDINPTHTIYSKSFQTLSEKLSLLMSDKKLKTVLLTGVDQSMGTATVIANLAIYLARKSGYKVLIIDADPMKYSLSKTFKVSYKPGLADVFDGKNSFMEVIQDLGSNLHILPPGEFSLNLVGFLGSSTMSDLLKKTGEQYDMVFINTSELNNFSDAVMISSVADGTAIVVNEGKERRQIIMNAINSLKQKNINVIGAILSNRKLVIPEIIYRIT